MTVIDVAAAVRSGRTNARTTVETALRRLEAANPAINVASRILAARARGEAASIDARIATGDDPGPLAGVPFGVKDLFDVAGLPTTAGARRFCDAAPAAMDAAAISCLTDAGAVLVATLNMDEFAYGFVTDNAHWGITRNPHDHARFAGGSSGGSAAVVAAGILPLALGSDTNGSVRIPAALCGVYGTKPTHGGLPMRGVFPFVPTLDDIGIFASTAADLDLIDSILRGRGGARSSTAVPGRVALLGGWFQRDLAPEMQAALSALSAALGGLPVVDLPDVARARSAAFLLTAYEGGKLHQEALRRDALGYDPATRDRLIAGAALPESVHAEALTFRQTFAGHVDAVFAQYDVLIAPTSFGYAPKIDDPTVMIAGKPQPARANLGLYTQPISFVGLPVVAAPLAGGVLPLGIQLIAAPGGDAQLLAFAAELEGRGLVKSRIAQAWGPS